MRENMLAKNTTAKEQVEELKEQLESIENKIDVFTKRRNELLSKTKENEVVTVQREEQKTLYDFFHKSYDKQMENITKSIDTLQQDVHNIEMTRVDL
jgi:uncharacterized protein YoxC